MDSKPIRRRTVVALLGIVALGLAVRAAFLVKDWDNLDFFASYAIHAEVARNILEGRWYTINPDYLSAYVDRSTAARRNIDLVDLSPPAHENLVPLYYDEGGYGVLLAGIWKLTGVHRWWPIRILQLLLDTAFCFVVFLLARMLANDRAGLVAAGLFAVFVPEIEMAVRPHRDVWVTFLFVGGTYFFLRWWNDRQRVHRLVLVAIMGAFIALMRSTAILFVPFAAAVFLILAPQKETVKTVVVMLAVYGLFLLPLIARNYKVFGVPMATRGAVWHSYWGGVGEFPNTFGLHEDDASIVAFARRLDSTIVFGTPEYESLLKKEAYRYMSEHPFDVISRICRRAFTIIFPKLGRALFFQPPVRPPTGFINSGYGSFLPIVVDTGLVLLAFAGFILCRNGWRMRVLGVLPLLYTLATLSPFVVQGRNIMNVYFVVLIFAAVAADQIWNDLQARRIFSRP